MQASLPCSRHIEFRSSSHSSEWRAYGHGLSEPVSDGWERRREPEGCPAGQTCARARQEKPGSMPCSKTLAADEFVRRFVIHVLPEGFHRMRHYGLFAKSACAENIAHARDLFAVSNSQGEPTDGTVDHSKSTCPCCGGRMIIIEFFERDTTPRHRPTAPTNRIRIDTS
jgi:hypothetical protein